MSFIVPTADKLTIENCLNGLNVLSNNNNDKETCFTIWGLSTIKEVLLKLKNANLITEGCYTALIEHCMEKDLALKATVKKIINNYQAHKPFQFSYEPTSRESNDSHLTVLNDSIASDFFYQMIEDDLINKLIQDETIKIKEETIKLYKLFDDLLSKKLREQNNEKKLLIIIGEDHVLRKSLLAELVVIKVAEKYGIKTLVTEADLKLIKKVRSVQPKKIDPNFSFLMHFIDKMGLKVIAADPDYKQNTSVREENMKSSVMELNENAILLSGLLHLFPFTSDTKLRSKFDILSINVANVSETVIMELKKTSKVYEMLLDLAHNPALAVQAKVDADINYVSTEKLVDLCDSTITEIAKKQTKQSPLTLGFLRKPEEDKLGKDKPGEDKQDSQQFNYSLKKIKF